MESNTPDLANLPEELLHNIFSYVANSPVLIGPCLCWSLRPLSKQWQLELDTERSDLWGLATQDLSCDYYECNNIMKSNEEDSDSKKSTKKKSRKQGESMSFSSNCSAERSHKRRRTQQTNQRRSTRLRPSTPKESYIHSHNLLLSRTESALLELTEHCQSSKKPLSLPLLQRLLKEHEPIAINQRVRTGGTFLVELCRARHVSERIILSCIKLLNREKWGSIF